MAIKIVYCLPSLHLVGGMEKVLTIKANYFAEKLGYDVTIVLTDGKDKPPFFKLSDKIKVINLDLNYEDIRKYPFILRFFPYSIKQLLFRKRLTELLMSIRPHITISMLRREINFLTKIKDGSIKIGEMQFNKTNYRDLNTKGESFGFKALLAKLWMNQLIHYLKKVDKFVVLSREDFEKWSELDNVTVIYNPIEKFPDRYSECDKKNIIAAGRFVNQKGFDLLLDSWAIVSAKHPDWHLSIYGSGNKTPYLKQITSNGIENSCTLHDALHDLTDVMCESSIFAFSSRFEGFALVLTEAMSCGLPPVAFSCPCGPKDLITDNVDGVLVTPENVAEFADKLCYLIENEDLRKAMGKRARERARGFTFDEISKEWVSLFETLLEGRPQEN